MSFGRALRCCIGSIALLTAGVLQASEVFRLDFDSFWTRVENHRFLSIDGLEVTTGLGADGSRALRATYRGSPIGSQRMVHAFDLGKAIRTAATLGYSVRFCPGFDFAEGGKLHGLGPRSVASGGLPVENGAWSARVVFTKGGGLATYIYHLGQQGRFGDVVRAEGVALVPGRWYRIQLNVVLNDPDQANGRVAIDLDGVRVADHEGLTFWRPGAPSYAIERFLFSTFYGGNSERFAPKDGRGVFVSTCADFDDFVVTVDG